MGDWKNLDPASQSEHIKRPPAHLLLKAVDQK